MSNEIKLLCDMFIKFLQSMALDPEDIETLNQTKGNIEKEIISGKYFKFNCGKNNVQIAVEIMGLLNDLAEEIKWNPGKISYHIRAQKILEKIK